jgi:hypothetical protein
MSDEGGPLTPFFLIFFSSLISCIGEGIRHVDEKVVDIASSTALVEELELCSVLDG